MSEIQIVPSNEDEKPDDNKLYNRGYLALPFQEDQFKEFIVGLLGKPQSFEKNYHGEFEISLEDIRHLNDLLNQRILQQNDGKLLNFTAILYFSDNSNVRINSYNEFLAYRELRPVACRSISLTWIYLIQFPDKTIPEKQEITVDVRTETDRTIDDEYTPEGFQTNIQYTARSWGYDIQALLEGEINSFFLPQKKLKKLINDYLGTIAIMFSSIFITITMFFSQTSLARFDNQLKVEMKEKMSSSFSVDAKIEAMATFLTEHKYQSYSNSMYLFVGISIIFSIGFASFLTIRFMNIGNRKSFILLTKQSHKDREIARKEENREWLWFTFSLVIGLSLDVLGNYLYDVLSK